MGAKISVIVPLYNVEQYLERSVSALRNQTYRNLEIILVDDGSTDQSGFMCDEFAKQDARIRVIHKENGGSSSARNRGLEAATGEYIAFSDSDDYAEPFLYEKLLDVLTTHDETPMAQMMATYFDLDGNAVWGPYRDSGQLQFISQEEMFRMLMMHVGDSSFCTKLIRADFMREFRFPEGELNEDFKILLWMLLKIKGVYSLEENGYNVELRQGSNTRSSFNPVYYDALIYNSDYAFTLMEEHFPNCRTEAVRFGYIQRLDYLLHIPLSKMTKDNKVCKSVIADIRKGRKEIRKNPFFTKKERRNLMILSFIPKGAKRFHNLLMHLRGIR